MTPDILLKALVDETRLRCVLLLVVHAELCVCEFTGALGMVQPKISRNLALLRRDKVLKDRRVGQWVYYRLHPELPAWALTIIQSLASGADGLSFCQEDLQRLSGLSKRPDNCLTPS